LFAIKPRALHGQANFNERTYVPLCFMALGRKTKPPDRQKEGCSLEIKTIIWVVSRNLHYEKNISTKQD